MNGKQLKNSILQWAIQGKLVPQDPNDEPASVLLERIRKEKEQLVKEKKIKKDKNASIIFRGEDNSYYEKFLATGEVKCIDDEIPFEIPQGWKWCRISSVFQLNPRIEANDDMLAAFIPMEAISAVYGSEYRYYERKWKEIKSGFTQFADGDIAFAKITPCFQNRKSAVFSNLPNGIGAGTTELKVLRPYGETINRFFVLYFLESPYFVDEATFKGTANQQRIIVGYLENRLFPLPPIEEQCRIASKITEVLPIVDRYGRTQTKLDNLNVELRNVLSKSILQEAIQGKLLPQISEEGTAQELLEQIRQEKQKLVKEGKLKKSALNDSIIFKGDDNKYYEQIGTKCIDISESIPFEVPIGWCWTRLSVISNLYTGNSISETEKATRYTNVQGMEYIGTKDVSFNHIVNYANGIAIPNEHISQFKIAPSRSVLLCIEGGSAGRKIAQIEKNVCFGNKLCCFVPYMMDISEYIYCYLQSPSFFENFRGNLAGIIGGVSVNTLKSLLIPLPPIEEQKRIVAQIEKLFEKLK